MIFIIISIFIGFAARDHVRDHVHHFLFVNKKSIHAGLTQSQEEGRRDGATFLREAGGAKYRLRDDQEKGNDWSKQQAGRCGCQHGLFQVYQPKASGDSSRQEFLLCLVQREERDLFGRDFSGSGEQAFAAPSIVSQYLRSKVASYVKFCVTFFCVTAFSCILNGSLYFSRLKL